jgi:hypothetical protein
MMRGVLAATAMVSIMGRIEQHGGQLGYCAGWHCACKTIHLNAFSSWLEVRFSETELQRLPAGELRTESHACSCYDTPTKHYPYLIVVLTTPKGDLVARPEQREDTLSFTTLAVRHGTRYCDPEAEDSCYGSFSDVCEFTDFRYGPYLAPFFPTCKSD